MSKWIVESIKVSETVIEAVVTAKESLTYLKQLTPAEQILVDSNEHSFVYKLEDKDAFVHLRFPEQLWRDLNGLKDKELPIYVVFHVEDENISIELRNFFNDLNSLIENIKGNANYGDSMVKAVETNFH